jgi:hypothetical protein
MTTTSKFLILPTSLSRVSEVKSDFERAQTNVTITPKTVEGQTMAFLLLFFEDLISGHLVLFFIYSFNIHLLNYTTTLVLFRVTAYSLL